MSYKWFGAEVLKQIEAIEETKLTVIAARIQEKARSLMREPKTGAMPAVPRKRGKGVVYAKHQRSAPGEAPAIQSGTLSRSITIEKHPKMRRVGPTERRGVYLELGTRHIEPRPYLRPALDKIKPDVDAILRTPI